MKISTFVLAAVAGVFMSSTPAIPVYGAPGAAPPPAVSTASSYRISGPFSSGNLSVFLIHGADAPNAGQYITLQEALQKKQVVVHETGDVNQLTIENKGTQLVFIQSGDIVKGGRQDRAVQFDLVLQPKSGKVPLASFCVEQGRWSPRGKEASGQFSSSSKQFVAKEMKLVAKTPQSYVAAAPRPTSSGAGAALSAGPMLASAPSLLPPPPAADLQGAMWNSVAKVQGKLGKAAKAKVTSTESESSLQLTLENDTVKKKGDTHIKALSKIVEGKSDAIGYAFAINGKVNSADVYASNALFVKLWPKLLDASATEAISEEGDKPVTAKPSVTEVRACLVDAEKAKPVISTTNGRTQLITRQQTQDNKNNVMFETQTVSGGKSKLWVHRNYLTK